LNVVTVFSLTLVPVNSQNSTFEYSYTWSKILTLGDKNKFPVLSSDRTTNIHVNTIILSTAANNSQLWTWSKCKTEMLRYLRCSNSWPISQYNTIRKIIQLLSCHKFIKIACIGEGKTFYW